MPRSRTAASMHFMRMPMYGGALPSSHAARTSRAARAAASSSSASRTCAVAVLEVDAQILDGLALQLGPYAVVHRLRRVRRAGRARRRTRRRPGRVRRGGPGPGRPRRGRCPAAKASAGYVDGVHGLAGAGLAGVAAGEFGVDRVPAGPRCPRSRCSEGLWPQSRRRSHALLCPSDQRNQQFVERSYPRLSPQVNRPIPAQARVGVRLLTPGQMPVPGGAAPPGPRHTAAVMSTHPPAFPRPRRHQPRHPFLDHPGPLAFAHRGGAADGLENTAGRLPATPSSLGYRYLETDVHATADGQLVAFHDATLDRVTDARGPDQRPALDRGAARRGWRAVNRCRCSRSCWRPSRTCAGTSTSRPSPRSLPLLDLLGGAGRVGPGVRRLVLRGPGGPRPGASRARAWPPRYGIRGVLATAAALVRAAAGRRCAAARCAPRSRSAVRGSGWWTARFVRAAHARRTAGARLDGQRTRIGCRSSSTWAWMAS